MARFVRFIVVATGIWVTAAPAEAGSQGAYVFCDNGLRCFTAPCPSNSALDLASGKIIKGVSIDISRLPQQDKALQDKLPAGKLVVAGAIENRQQTFNGKRYSLPTLVATGIERASRDSERKHCSAR